MKKVILFIMTGAFLNACQTHLPVVSQMEESGDMACDKNIKQLERTSIDYLLYANRMIDAMIQDHNVQLELREKRINLYLQPIKDKNNSTNTNMDDLNHAIKNRVIRSAQFIVVNDAPSADVKLSGFFENKEVKSYGCIDSYEQFSLQLKDNQTGQMIWTDKTNFK